MTLRSLTAALTLYRSGALTLEQATERGGVSEAKLKSELRSRGIRIREEAGTDGPERTTT
jgi:predicted HTH domain antitoxin